MKLRNGEELFDLIAEADDLYVADAARKPKKRVRPWLPIVAAAMALLLVFGAFSMNGIFFDGEDGETGRYTPGPADPSYPYNTALLGSFGIRNVTYPSLPRVPDATDSDARYEWNRSRIERKKPYYRLETEPLAFFERAIPALLAGKPGENVVCSPLNVYVALAMTAEITGGESRAEILALLGEKDMESLRKTASAVYAATYCDDGAVTCILASSLWLDKDYAYVEETVDRLAEAYYTSSYSGEMGSEDYNEALRAWLNRETGGLLSDQIAELEMTPETVLALATTVYFNARWYSAFDAERNSERIFSGASGDVLATFMNTSTMQTYYWGERFSSASVGFDLGGGLEILLPDEGVTPEELLSDAEALSYIVDPHGYGQHKYVVVNLSIPKFDVSSELDLCDGLKELGVTSVFDASTADFAEILPESEGEAFIGEIKHGVRVVIDEEGCTAAAYTVELVCGSGCPTEEVDFIVDRPFLFVVRSEIGLPLFVGIVNDLGA